MKKLFAVALLVNLNLYTMECFKIANKPYRVVTQKNPNPHDTLIPSAEKGTKKHHGLDKIFKTKSSKKKDEQFARENEPDCFTFISRVITLSTPYENQ